MITKGVSPQIVDFMSASLLGSRHSPKDEDRDAIEAYSLSTLLKDESENIRPFPQCNIDLFLQKIFISTPEHGSDKLST